MTQQYSFAHIRCIINGHLFQGWATDDPPYELEEDESSERTRGRDGALYSLELPTFGGTYTFKMQHNSPTTQWAIQQEQARKNAHLNGEAFRSYSGTFADPTTNTNYRLDGGVIVRIPSQAIPGQTFEFMIEFESITSNVDAATTRAPLSA